MLLAAIPSCCPHCRVPPRLGFAACYEHSGAANIIIATDEVDDSQKETAPALEDRGELLQLSVVSKHTLCMLAHSKLQEFTGNNTLLLTTSVACHRATTRQRVMFRHKVTVPQLLSMAWTTWQIIISFRLALFVTAVTCLHSACFHQLQLPASACQVSSNLLTKVTDY